MLPGIDPCVDFAFKRLFGSESSKAILIDLLNAVLSPAPPIREITLLNPSTEKEADQDKQTVFDIRASDQGNRQFLLEMQRIVPWFFAKRTLYCWAVAYRDQLKQGEHYATLQPTFALCVLDDNLIDDERVHHVFRMVDNQTQIELCKDAEIHTIELKKFHLSAEELKTPLERWCYFLKHGEELDTEHLPATLDVPGIHQAMEVLMRINESAADRHLYNRRFIADCDEASHEYDRKFGKEIARAEGLAEGLAEGEARGEAKGEAIGKIHFAQRLLKQPLTPREELLSLSPEDLTKQAEQLEQQILGGNTTA